MNVLSHSKSDKQTDRQIHKQTDRQRDRESHVYEMLPFASRLYTYDILRLQITDLGFDLADESKRRLLAIEFNKSQGRLKAVLYWFCNHEMSINVRALLERFFKSQSHKACMD